MPGLDDVKAELSREMAGAGFVQRLAERVGLSARASAVFGEAVEREGVTVIPVAKAAWGFGGGSGGEDMAQGSGGGGGSFVAPLGFIEVRDGGAQFIPLRDPRLTVIVIAGAAGVLLVYCFAAGASWGALASRRTRLESSTPSPAVSSRSSSSARLRVPASPRR